MYQDETGTYRFRPGTLVGEAAEEAWAASRPLERGSGEHVQAEFNGTPMAAYPTDECAQVVFLRWHYERLLLQAGAS